MFVLTALETFLFCSLLVMLSLHGVVHAPVKTMQVCIELSGRSLLFLDDANTYLLESLCQMSFLLCSVFCHRSKPVVNDILGTGLGTNNTSNAIREEREVGGLCPCFVGCFTFVMFKSSLTYTFCLVIIVSIFPAVKSY